jgi:hypothetical protein
MFVKLNQHPTSWWFCVTITSILSACILTVLLYPAYAALASAVCHRNVCVGGCGPCNADGDGLGADGWYEFQADVTGYSHWVEGNLCKGRVNTYHRSQAENKAANSQRINWGYTALFLQPGGHFNQACTPQGFPPISEGSFVVPVGQKRTNTFSQSQTYVLGPLDVECEYQVKALTEFTFQTGRSGDIKSTAPNGVFEACP